MNWTCKIGRERSLARGRVCCALLSCLTPIYSFVASRLVRLFSRPSIYQSQFSPIPYLRILAVLSTLSLLASPAWAQEAAGLDVGEAKLYPSVKISVVANDNLFGSRLSAVESNGVLVQPNLLYAADLGQNAIDVGYLGSYLNTEESAANYADHRIFFRGKAAFSKRAQLLADLSYDIGHLGFGSFLSRGEVSSRLEEPYQFDEFRLNTRLRYGAQQARGNLTVGISARDTSYSNEPDPLIPDRTDGLDFSSVTPYFIFSLRVSGDTRAFLDVRFDSVDYDPFVNSNTAELDNDRVRAYLGSSWEVTGRTGGSFKIGTIDTDFADPSRSDSQILGLELDAFYAFKPYSRLQVGITREQNDLADNQELGRKDKIDLNWKHTWSTRFNTEAGVVYTTTFGECVAGSGAADRENNDLAVVADLNLQLRRWLSVGLGYKFDDGESSACPGDADDAVRQFERNRIDAHVQITL